MSKIPEGATHISDCEIYYKKGNDSWRFFSDGKWNISSLNRIWGDENLTSLQPTQWLPEIGQECEYECTARGKEPKGEGVVKYISNYTCVVENFDGIGEFVAHPDTIKFRPLKTEREKFVDRFVELSILDNKELVKRLAYAAYDKGARFND